MFGSRSATRGVVAATIACCFGSPWAASEWSPMGLQGRLVRTLAAAPDLLCAGTQSDGVFCADLSTPGAAWESLGLAEVAITGLWIDPSSPNLIFAAAGEDLIQPALLYRTTDGGSNWEAADGNLTHPPSKVHGVPGSSTVYSAGFGVWRSDDLGDTWTQTNFDAIWSLDVAPTDGETVWAGGETVLFQGFTLLSRDGGATWSEVWNSSQIGDNQTADISAHPLVDGLVLTGHEGFVLRTTDHGNAFDEVLSAPARFFLDWDLGNPDRAYAAGSPNSPAEGHAFVSRDLGQTWSAITGALEAHTVFSLAADGRRLGVVYAATEDGVFRFYGGGVPLCLVTTAGGGHIELERGACPPGSATAEVIVGDAVVGRLSALDSWGHRIDLGEVECILDDADVALADIDPPEPPPGDGLFVLVRPQGAVNYGAGSAGLPRLVSLGDCSP